MAETTQVANQEPQTFSVALTEKLNSVAEGKIRTECTCSGK